MKLWDAILGGGRPRKFVASDDAVSRRSAPPPPANRMTDATGWSGFIRMNACVAPLGVGIETSVAVSARAVMGMPAESIVSKKAMRRERAMVDVPYHGSSDTIRGGSSLQRQHYICSNESFARGRNGFP